MAIEDVDGWLYGDGPEDLDEYFVEFETLYSPGEVSHGVCAGCGEIVFGMHGNLDTGDVEWTCRGCGRMQLVPGCERSWLPGRPTPCGCDCGGSDFNVAVCLSTRPSDRVRYLSMVERCTFCGLLATFVAKKLPPKG
jgi:hypothetical protein